MSESAAERKARLKAMREAAEKEGDLGEEGPTSTAEAGDGAPEAAPSTSAYPVLKFRNYNVKDAESIQHVKVEAAKVPEVEEIVADPEAVMGNDPEEVLINVAPKKANWELRRAIAPQLAKLDRRTQEAMITLMKAEQASAAAV
ncbi:hypothetical protein ACKKBG_A06430 [Auxenochlorella protothecoides x Auxenochlorella symbiontica]